MAKAAIAMTDAMAALATFESGVSIGFQTLRGTGGKAQIGPLARKGHVAGRIGWTVDRPGAGRVAKRRGGSGEPPQASSREGDGWLRP